MIDTKCKVLTNNDPYIIYEYYVSRIFYIYFVSHRVFKFQNNHVLYFLIKLSYKIKYYQ